MSKLIKCSCGNFRIESQKMCEECKINKEAAMDMIYEQSLEYSLKMRGR